MIFKLGIAKNERFEEIKDALDKKESSPPPPYWILESIEDAGCDFCITCIKEMLPNGEWGEHYDGGYCCESDGSVHCEKCGKVLQYTLTDYGVETEMQYFEEYGVGDLTPDKCHELARIAHGISTKQQALKFIALFKEKV